MLRWKPGRAGIVVAVLSTSLFTAYLSLGSQAKAAGAHPAEAAAAHPAKAAAAHPATGVGSCTLKGWNPSTDPNDAKDLPEGQRPQTYKRDDYNCTGAKFAAKLVGIEDKRRRVNLAADFEDDRDGVAVNVRHGTPTSCARRNAPATPVDSTRLRIPSMT